MLERLLDKRLIKNKLVVNKTVENERIVKYSLIPDVTIILNDVYIYNAVTIGIYDNFLAFLDRDNNTYLEVKADNIRNLDFIWDGKIRP